MARPSSQPYLHDSSAQASEQAPQARPTASTATKCATRGSLRWRVTDIAVGAAVGVMSGVMFWVFDGLSYGLFPLLTLILPGSRRCCMHCSTFRDAGFVDRAQAGRVRLRAVGRLVRRSGAWYEIQCEPGGDRACAGACRRSGVRGVPLPSLDAWRHVAVGRGDRHCIQLLPVVLLLPGVFVLQSAWTHRHGMRVAERGRIRRVRFVGPLPSLGQVGSPHPLRSGR